MVSYGCSSSSSVRPVSSGSRRADGDFGLPRRCVCGRLTIIKTSRTHENPGRRFYTCPMSDDGGMHTWKWWDQCMMEELTILRHEIQEQDKLINAQAERMTHVLTQGSVRDLPPMENTSLIDEVKEVRELQNQNAREIQRVKNGILVGLMIVTTVWFLFK